MYNILTYNNISSKGLERLPTDRFQVGADITEPDAIMLRSYSLHGVAIPAGLKAVGRAGAGVNNIPVADYSKLGIPVFNAPGANANAVKELAIAGMLIASRNLCAAWEYVRRIEGEEEALESLVEKGKKQFAGFELAGKTLGVIGLGAIGVQVANAAIGLGMKVLGYDPALTVQRAWQLSSSVEQATGIDDLLARANFVTLHVPLNEHTRNLLNAKCVGLLQQDAVLLNFSRAGVVDEQSLQVALDSGRIHAYVSDFPNNRLKNHPRVIQLPHLGASTEEAEENCAVMVAEQIKLYLETGSIRNSVNFPDVELPINGSFRISVVNANIPNMVSRISTRLADSNLNISELINKSRGDLAYTLVDVDGDVTADILDDLSAIQGVLAVRALGRIGNGNGANSELSDDTEA